MHDTNTAQGVATRMEAAKNRRIAILGNLGVEQGKMLVFVSPGGRRMEGTVGEVTDDGYVRILNLEKPVAPGRIWEVKASNPE